MFTDYNIQRKPDAFDRLLKLLTVLFSSPHLLFGTAIWAYVAYCLLAVSGLVGVTVINQATAFSFRYAKFRYAANETHNQ